MLKLATVSLGDGEAAESGGDCVETGRTCPFSKEWALLSSSHLLTVWKHMPSGFLFFFFSRETGSQTIYGKSLNFGVLVIFPN